MKRIKLYPILAIWIMVSCHTPEPVLNEYYPDFGPPETLVTVEGEHFSTVHTLNFNDGIPADFNTSYGSDHALLFRVPENAPLGDNQIIIATEGGMLELDFRVTLEAPKLLQFFPDQAPIGDQITFIGENFFEPLEILFHDSIPGEIISREDEKLVVKVPEGASKGFIKIKANGGKVITNKNFQPTFDHLISNFDGDGIHGNMAEWLFYGSINENAMNAVQNSSPESLEGNYLKISSSEATPIWIGGTEHPSFYPDVFDVYDIQSDLSNTFLSFDVNNNGKEATVLSIILKQRGGSFNDFSETIEIKNEGWQNISIPLSRFTDLDQLTIDPTDIKVVKLHLVNPDSQTESMEINIDNLKFVEVL